MADFRTHMSDKGILSGPSSKIREQQMREKQQSRPRARTALAAGGCVIGCLTAALAAPALAVPTAGRTAHLRPNVMVTGQPLGIAADPTTHTFWVAELAAGKPADIVDKITESGHTITTLHVTSGVAAIAADASRGLVWTIGNSSDGSTHTVTYIKESDDSVHPVTVPAGSDLTGLAVDPAAGKVFVVDVTGDVFTFDEAHLTSAPVKLITGDLAVASGLAVDHGTDAIWVLNAVGNSAIEFNESTGAMVGSPVSVGNNPGAIAIDTTTKTVWVASADSTISEFAEATPGTVHTITLGSVPISLTADPTRRMIWAGGQFGSIYGITERTSPPSLTGGLTLPSEVDGLATDQKTGQLWATEDITSQGRFDNVVPFVPAPPAYTSADSTWLAAGNTAQDQFTVTTSGFPPATFSLRGAPSWLSLARFTGVLSANLTTSSKLGAFKATITASNGVGSAVHQAFTVHVGTDPVVTTTSATFAVGVKNTFQIRAKGTPEPMSFSGLGLPKGLHVSKSGLLSGSLPKGTHSPVTFVIEASNQVTEAFHSPVPALFKLKLVPGRAPKFTSASKATLRPGVRASFTINATGFPIPTLKVAGKMPSGLRIRVRTSKAFIKGKPAAADAGHTYKITITASNGVGKPVSQTLTIKIT
jgi:hypothetical protein